MHLQLLSILSYQYPNRDTMQDTIWPTHVVAMARRERMEPRRLSLRSVIDAIPTPRSKTRRESLILWLQEIAVLVISNNSIRL